MESQETKIELNKRGLVDDGVLGYTLKFPNKSILEFGIHQGTRPQKFVIFKVFTYPNEQHKGYATKLLNAFFQIVKKMNGYYEVSHFTKSGKDYIRHVIDKLSKKYDVKVTNL
jgi:GNAT superfamily N-acetyltransferase